MLLGESADVKKVSPVVHFPVMPVTSGHGATKGGKGSYNVNYHCASLRLMFRFVGGWTWRHESPTMLTD